MEDATELEAVLATLMGSGRVEVHENGQWLAALSGGQYEVRRQGNSTLLHIWSEEHNLVRRVLRVAEQSAERVVLEVQRFGQARPGTLEILCAGAERSAYRLTREKFRARFRQMLAEQFPDEQIDSLTTTSDLEHSLSGRFTRGLLHRGQRAWAVLGVSPAEDATTIDTILTSGLIWLDRARQQARGKSVAGLRLFLPEGASRVTAHRLSALAPSTRIELYELNETQWRARPIDPRDIGNLATWLTPRREVDSTLAAARPAVEKIRARAPEAIRACVSPGTREVALRFRGLEFARWDGGAVFFGLGDERQELTQKNWKNLEKLIQQLETARHPLATDTAHPLYRVQAERWLESIVQEDPMRIDARLDPTHLYSQVPAFAAGDRGVIDLLGVTRDGRLAVVELKANEDLHLPLQAVDYWLRVRWHHQQDDFHHYGYFAGTELRPEPPLLFLVAPGLRFHPATDVVLRYLSREVEIMRVGLNENWRRGLQVIFRQ